MSWIYLVITVPLALAVAALVHDFLSGISEERVWADPAIDDSGSPSV